MSWRFLDTNRKICIPVLPVDDGQQTCRCAFPVDVCASCFLVHGTCSCSVAFNPEKDILSVLAGNRVFKELWVLFIALKTEEYFQKLEPWLVPMGMCNHHVEKGTRGALLKRATYRGQSLYKILQIKSRWKYSVMNRRVIYGGIMWRGWDVCGEARTRLRPEQVETRSVHVPPTGNQRVHKAIIPAGTHPMEVGPHHSEKVRVASVTSKWLPGQGGTILLGMTKEMFFWKSLLWWG